LSLDFGHQTNPKCCINQHINRGCGNKLDAESGQNWIMFIPKPRGAPSRYVGPITYSPSIYLLQQYLRRQNATLYIDRVMSQGHT